MLLCYNTVYCSDTLVQHNHIFYMLHMYVFIMQINLASQSVLEGLNAVLDHRAEVFIPELGMQFSVQPGTKLFACQNPVSQGGGRKGLPKSFLNRFTKVNAFCMVHMYVVCLLC